MLGRVTTASTTVSTWEKSMQRYSALELTRLDEDHLVELSGFYGSNRGREPGEGSGAYLLTWSGAPTATLAPNTESKNVRPGVAVQWAELHTQAVTRPSGETMEIGPISATKKKLRPNLGQARRFWPDNEYQDDSRFAMLGLCGILIPVSIHQKFPIKDDASVAAKLTGDISDFSRDMWRHVTTLEGGQQIVTG
ncbi:hypothetical protein F5Y09DRAFT_220178 [Xylaria sp. FL1042]|nr:hypothetical protein F5Y09DRAFT_220178 [Xylaria sp. FL1042]